MEYSGRLSHEARSRAMTDFRDKPKKKIMLASLHAGGLGAYTHSHDTSNLSEMTADLDTIGLNLTMASYVLLLDPWVRSSHLSHCFDIR